MGGRGSSREKEACFPEEVDGPQIPTPEISSELGEETAGGQAGPCLDRGPPSRVAGARRGSPLLLKVTLRAGEDGLWGVGEGEGKAGAQALVIVFGSHTRCKPGCTKASPGVGKDKEDIKYFSEEYYRFGDQSVVVVEGEGLCLQVTVTREIHGKCCPSLMLGLLPCQ